VFNILLHINAFIFITPSLPIALSSVLGGIPMLETARAVPVLFTIPLALLPSFILWASLGSSDNMQTITLFETSGLLFIIYLGEKWERDAEGDLSKLEGTKFAARSA
jgi:hypothetical protein